MLMSPTANLCAGTKAQLMVRILAYFGLSRPCSAPMLVVAHSKVHAILVLSGICKIHYYGRGSLATAAQGDLCSQLYLQLIHSAPQEVAHAAGGIPHYWLPLSAEMQSTAKASAQSAAPALQAAFHTFRSFHQVSWYDRS